MSLLVARDLDFSYPSRRVLKQVSVKLRPGRITGIIGPNGSGKSTLLKCLNRILKYKRGSILINGRSLEKIKLRELAKEIGYVPQNGTRIGAVTVAEVVLLGRRPHLRFRVGTRDRTHVEKALAELGISALAKRSFDELSGGEKQKALLARALAQQTGILLLDEPTSNLDPRHQLEVMELLAGLKTSRNLSLAVVLHDLNLAARYADELVLLHQGRVLASGSVDRVLTPDNLSRAFGIRAEVGPDRRGNLRLDIIGTSDAEATDPGRGEG